MRKLALIAVLVLAGAACSGPRSPLDVGVREINTDVLIGPQRPRPVIALPPATPSKPVGFPGFIQPPIDTEPEPTPGPAPACPVADPLASVAHEVSSSVAKPPIAARHPFRNNGLWKYGDRTGAFPASAERRIENIQLPQENGDFTFDISIPDRAGTTTTTTYHVYPVQPRPAFDPGLYIEQVVTSAPGQSPEVFTPTPSLLLLRFPATIGTTWSSRGVDPLTQVVESFDATVLSRDIVDACGTKLQAWKVDISNGRIAGPTIDLSFSATLWIAPQFGGLILKDKVFQQGTVKRSATDPSVDLESENTAQITVAPRFPA